MKHHPYFRTLLGGASERLGYGARVLNEGGLQSIPKLAFPGGALLGCAAGFVNVPKIKGTHNAMKSGMLAAEAAFSGLRADPQEDAEPGAAEPVDMQPYADALEKSWVYDELRAVRNMRPAFNTPLGVPGGVAYSGLDAFVLRGRVPWTFRNRTRASDAAHTKPAAECEKIEYPPFEAPLSTDLLTSVALTGTNHAEEQPAHLRVVGTPADPARTTGSGEGAETAATRAAHVERNVGTFAGLLGRACPAAVYEYVEDDGPAGREDAGGWNGHKLVINAQVRFSKPRYVELVFTRLGRRTAYTASCAT
jgi:electron-transferring-flavoprotein dehydrogenase